MAASTSFAPSAAATDASSCTSEYSVTSTAWRYRTCGIPDLDQDRIGLPENGRNYCGPTAATNALYYFDGHGYSNLISGESYDPMRNVNFSSVTGIIARVGLLSDTNPLVGTDDRNLMDGLREVFDVTGYGARLGVYKVNMKRTVLSPSRILTLYSQHNSGVNTLLGLIGIYEGGELTGTHMVTIAGASGFSTGQSWITVHNPKATAADDISTQSATVERLVALGDDDGNGAELINWGSAGKKYRLDSIIGIGPRSYSTPSGGR
ncbi:hypothetical protein [Streptomyces chartreusis]|uniref:hypothetical protein n=1 Tax=Streptomyces chartreusis TaxID=1969 RepID=UPI00381A43F9